MEWEEGWGRGGELGDGMVEGEGLEREGGTANEEEGNVGWGREERGEGEEG